MTNSSLGVLVILAGVVTALFAPMIARENVALTRAFWKRNVGERFARVIRMWGYFVAACLVLGGACLIIFG
ncbi:MAG: hypothetical protein M3N32_05955 [Actinomycetota bacterium]|nr:hypothetical protein [Actinomycetota bacterium]